MSSARLVRSSDLLVYWDAKGLIVKDLAGKSGVDATPEVLFILDRFSRPRTPASVVNALSEYEAGSVLAAIRALRRLRLLLPADEGRRRGSRIRAWKGNLASALYHVASRDMTYIADPAKSEEAFRTQIAVHPRPARFKRYPASVRRPLLSKKRGGCGTDLDDVLGHRRTVREFTREPVEFEDFAAAIGRTWGRTGWIDAGEFGLYATKTSPSAGALHPIECYVLAWNVRSLPPGLYHYDVAADELRRLRSGNLSSAAVRAASGQRWVGRAAFLCVLTAVFTRSLWKYGQENAYRDVWLDAGHLAQTFCLLATSRGLGPFTTVALQDSYIEALIGLDGVREFPVYLCGAGKPARSLARSLNSGSRSVR
jgi:SagB-type dehydrogenase family enzyme